MANKSAAEASTEVNNKNWGNDLGRAIDPGSAAASDYTESIGLGRNPGPSNAFGDLVAGKPFASSQVFGKPNDNITDFKNELLGSKPNTFQASNAVINSGTDQNQIDKAYQQSQGGLASQQSLLAALNSQNGIGNQNQFLAQQQQLANMLQMQAQGQGPNPAQAQLAQATQANTANQAALMAGQRGASANSGMLARQAAMQGASNQQQAAGQAATMGAQQQIAAQQQLGAQQQAMQGVAGQQVGNLMNQNTGYNQLAQNQQQMLLNANSAANNANVGMQSNINNVNSTTAIENQRNSKGVLGGVMSGIGAVFGMAHGGMVPERQGYASGGMVSGPQSGLGQLLASGQDTASRLAGTGVQDQGMNLSAAIPQSQDNPYKQYKDGQKGMSGLKGKLQGLTSSGSSSSSSSGGGLLGSLFSQGGHVPGQAQAKGDSPTNDTVPAMLSPGEVVIPRSIMNSKNPAEQAKKFVQAILAKQGAK